MGGNYHIRIIWEDDNICAQSIQQGFLCCFCRRLILNWSFPPLPKPSSLLDPAVKWVTMELTVIMQIYIGPDSGPCFMVAQGMASSSRREPFLACAELHMREPEYH